MTPAFDRCAIEAHVSLIHDLAEGLDGVLILAAFAERGAAQVQRFRIGDVNAMVETIMGFENYPDLNLYVPWSVFRRDLEPGKKGREADVSAVLAAVADMDGDKGINTELPIEAPYIIETSPGNCQPVYVFDKPMSAGDAKPVLAALSDFIGGDSGTKDCSHVWRVPGTLNIPTKSKLARGRPPVPASVTVKKQFTGRFISPAQLLALAPRPRPNGPDPAPQRSLSFDEEARLRIALAAIPANDRDAWLKVGAALHLHGARAVWDDWSRTSSKFDAADQDRVWASFHADRKDGVITIATIYAWAKERDWRKTGNGDDRVCIAARPFVWRDPKTIPPRQWLYGQHYIRKFVSATIAAPGIGKSSLDLVELIAMASGRPLLGVPVPKQLRVWYWNLEDPYDEIERRIAAVLLHFNIDPAEIEGRLFINSGRDDPLVIAEVIKGALAIYKPVTDALAAEIVARCADVLAVDPFVSCHRVPENDNGAIDAVTKAWSKIADTANCATDLVHHVRKPANSQAEFDVNDARGASALIGTVRAARVLNSMTKEDAEAAGVSLKHKGYYFSVTNGKANMSPPAEKAEWFKFVSVPLGNDTPENPGDQVGVVIAWKRPGLFDGMTAASLFMVQKAIAARQWREDHRSPDWVGNAVASVLGLDATAPADKTRIKEMLKVWITNKALKIVEKPGPDRHCKLFVEVAQWAT